MLARHPAAHQWPNEQVRFHFTNHINAERKLQALALRFGPEAWPEAHLPKEALQNKRQSIICTALTDPGRPGSHHVCLPATQAAPLAPGHVGRAESRWLQAQGMESTVAVATCHARTLLRAGLAHALA